MPEFSILVLEDDAMLSLAMEDILQKLGCKNLTFAFDLTSAMEIAETGSFSIAFLDVDLNGELSLPVARLLRQKDVPCFFTTGFGSRFDYEDMQDAPIIRKPYSEREIKRALQSVDRH